MDVSQLQQQHQQQLQHANQQQRPESSNSLLKLIRSATNLARSSSVKDLAAQSELNRRNTLRHSSQLEIRPIPLVNLAEKAKELKPEIQGTFRRCMGELQQQESDSLIAFLQEARRALRDTENNLHDEQRVLAATANKISESRLGSAGSKDRVRLGAQSARHRPKGPGQGSPTRSGSRSSGPVSARSIHLSASTPRGHQPVQLSSSWGGRDSVTFESERFTSAGRRGKHDKIKDNMANVGGAVPYDSDEEYQEEKNVIMTQASGVMNRTEQERERQAAILKERKEQKKVQQIQSAREATDLMREATGIEAIKQKDRERQEQIVKERLEERKKTRDRSTPVVVDLSTSSHT